MRSSTNEREVLYQISGKSQGEKLLVLPEAGFLLTVISKKV